MGNDFEYFFWDQLSVMPVKASSYRAEQNALIAKTKHEKSTSSEYEKTLLKPMTNA